MKAGKGVPWPRCQVAACTDSASFHLPMAPLEDEDTEARREQLNSPTEQVLPAASLQREEVSAQRGKVTCPRSHSNRWQKWARLAV